MITSTINKLSKFAIANDMLQDICCKLKQEFDLIPYIGTEIEFYLLNDNISGAPFVIKGEKGLHQYEIDLPPLSNATLAADAIIKAKIELQKWHPDINFAPKPFADDYGSAMHFHINLLRGDTNYYDDQKKLEDGAQTLCHYLKQTFLVFAPSEDHYARFEGKMMAPTKVAYGGNNRSVAIRIPDAKPSRLEHRVASPMTDPHLAIFTILKSLYLGLKNPSNLRNYTKIYGNAFDDQYDLELLPANLKEAAAAFDEGFYSIT